MNLKDWQALVNEWILTIGVRYFDIKTNTLLLQEEVGEFSRLIARIYGEQSFKRDLSEEEKEEMLKSELGDIVFVATCLANQLGYSMEEIVNKAVLKRNSRDSIRHINNPKLRNENK